MSRSPHSSDSPAADSPAPASLRERALEIIRLAISSGELDEGQIYSAAGLAKQLSMSLSPVREAMMSLVSEGTVEAIPNRGFRLVPITPEDLEELIRIRLRLAEPAVAHLCDLSAKGRESLTYGGTTLGKCLNELQRLSTAALQAAETEDSHEFFRGDREFHRALLEHGLGPRAASISLRLRDQSRLSHRAQKLAAVDVQSASDLGDLVAAIESERHDEAAELIRQNLYYFKREVLPREAPPQ